MQRPVYIKAGKVNKPFGNQGQLMISLEPGYMEVIPDTGHLFMQVDGSYLPFFVEEWQGDEEVLVKLEEIDNPESAAKYSGKLIFLSQQQVPDHVQRNQDLYLDLTGFEAYNENELLGPISEVLDYPAQKLLKIEHNGKDVLIPLVEDFIVSIDTKARKIVLKIHEALLNL